MFIFGGQASALILNLLVHSWITFMIHSFDHFLVGTQRFVSSGQQKSQLTLKLKIDSILDRLTYGQKYGLTCGNICVFTHSTICQLFVSYVYVVMLTYYSYGINWFS